MNLFCLKIVNKILFSIVFSYMHFSFKLSGHLHTYPEVRLGKHKYGQFPLLFAHSVVT